MVMLLGEQAAGAFMWFPDDEQLQVSGAHVLNDGVTGVQGARVDDRMKMMIRSLTEEYATAYSCR
jgi:hypothetical protein